MIAIIDYGLGNVGSIANMLRVIGEKSVLTSLKEDILMADGIILPGVGSFDAGMNSLNDSGLSSIITECAEKGKPILGICLGMQLLGEKSEEGHTRGLSLIPFECIKFNFDNTDLKVPHMGWDVVSIRKVHPIVNELEPGQRYYFVHSYHAVCKEQDNVLMTCDYGYSFAAAVCKHNIIGVQFHPEKSHDFGLAFLNSFVDICRGKNVH